MKVIVNGQARDLPAGSTVASVIRLLDVSPGARGVAVALDGEVVARSQWEAAPLREGALVEIVAAIQGG